jgi:hypothetical protein
MILDQNNYIPFLSYKYYFKTIDYIPIVVSNRIMRTLADIFLNRFHAKKKRLNIFTAMIFDSCTILLSPNTCPLLIHKYNV